MDHEPTAVLDRRHDSDEPLRRQLAGSTRSFAIRIPCAAKTPAETPAPAPLEKLPSAALPAGAARAARRGVVPRAAAPTPTRLRSRAAPAIPPAFAPSPSSDPEPGPSSEQPTSPEGSSPRPDQRAPLAEKAPEVTVPPVVELPELPGLPIVGDPGELPVVGSLLPSGGEESGAEQGGQGGPVEEIVDDLPDLPLPEPVDPLPPLLP